jgi:hypothetical protein
MRIALWNSPRLLTVLALAAPSGLAVSQAPQVGTVRGTVRAVDGSVLPGSAITLEGPDDTWADVTGNDGGYRFERVPAGSYSVRVDLSGFCSESIADVEVSHAQVTTVDFSLWLGGTGWNEREGSENLQIVRRLADIVAHVRVERRFDARMWSIGSQRKAGVAYRSRVIDAHPTTPPGQDTLRVVQYPAGSLVANGQRYCGSEPTLPDGSEYVVFLNAIEDSDAYAFLGPRFLIPVVDGRLIGEWLDDTELDAVHDGMEVAEFLEIVRRFPDEVGSLADSTEARVAALRHVLREETERLARAGLPRASERLTYCVAASPTVGAAGAVPTALALFNQSFGRRSDPDPEYLARLASETYDLFPASKCDGSTDTGSPMINETRIAVRGLIRVGPAFHAGDDRVEIPASVFRHMMSAASWILYLEKQAGVWRVVDQKFIWGA